MLHRRIVLLLIPILLGFPVFLLGQRMLRASIDWNSPKFHELGYSRSHLSDAHNLSTDLKSALVRAISGRLRPHMADLEIADEKELRKLAEQSRFELLDLNGDGVMEVIVQPIRLKAGCGATGNCPLWIFARTPKQYRLLVEIEGVQMYRQERSGNQGYPILRSPHMILHRRSTFMSIVTQMGPINLWRALTRGGLRQSPARGNV